MAFEFAGRTGKRSRRGFSENLTICRSRREATADKPAFDYVEIRIPVDTMKALRWVIGDRADPMYDPETGQLLLKRVTNGGFKICNATGDKTETTGKIEKGRVKFTPGDRLMAKLPNETMFPDDVTVTEDGLLIELK